MSSVSVLMPIYRTNHSHLKEAIESVLNQTYQDFEFLILNDSPDDKNLEEFVLSYKDKRIKYFKNEKNMGITPSRNKLISLATGKYLMVMDHDDISLPTRMEEQVAFLEKHKEIGVVGSFVKQMVCGKEKSYPIENDLIEKNLMFSCAIAHSATMIRASVLKENNIFYEEEFSPAEDYALYCRLIGKTKFYNIPKILFLYRDHAGNTSHKQRKKMDMATFLIYEMVHRKNSLLWKEVLKKIILKNRVYLFGIPLYVFKQKGYTIEDKLHLFYRANIFHEKKSFFFGVFSRIGIGKKIIYQVFGISFCQVKSKILYQGG